METVKRGLGDAGLMGNGTEKFQCSRCGYGRPLRLGEDGYRVYILHEQRCNPALAGQTWLPFITEDDLVLPPVNDKIPALPDARPQPLLARLRGGGIPGAAALYSRKAA